MAFDVIALLLPDGNDEYCGLLVLVISSPKRKNNNIQCLQTYN